MFDQIYNALVYIHSQAQKQAPGKVNAFIMKETTNAILRIKGVTACILTPVSFPWYIRYRVVTRQGVVFIEWRWEAGELACTFVTQRRIYTI